MARAITGRASARRIQLLAVLVVGIFALLAMRAAWLGVVRASWLSSKADRQHLLNIAMPAERGAILSADNQYLAVDQPTMEITADGRFVADPVRTADTLLSTLGGTPALRERIISQLSAKKAYVVITKNASIRDGEHLRKLSLPGVTFRRSTRRSYPMGPVAAQVIGFTSLETGKGVEGLEARLESKLAGKDGKRIEVRDPRAGVTVRIQDLTEPVPGKGVQLTINAAIQRKLEESMLEAVSTTKAKGASGVVMDPNTGAIVAMASVPRINANNRAKLDVNATQARAVTDPYEPGSVFKVVTVAGALEEGLTTPTTRYNVPPYMEFLYEGKQRKVEEAHKRTANEVMTTADILVKSSNVGTILISRSLKSRNKLRYWMDRFGFGHRTGIDLGNESAGLLPKLKWNAGQAVNIPFGQGMDATMIQQVRAYAAIANGGELVTPYVVASVNGRASAHPSPVRIFSKQTANEMTAIMERVVEGSTGTGVKASINAYRVAGKTGTAQKIEGGKYVDRYRSSFIGFVPANRPQLVIAVMIDDPDPAGLHTGGDVAAPVFTTVGDYALSTLSISPN